ncbi:MAG: glycosyltransferase [Steroidobacteraceae bacterium]
MSATLLVASDARLATPAEHRDRPLHVVQIGFFEDSLGRAPERLLDDWPTLVDVAECASRAGVRVSVLQTCTYEGTIARNGVDYHFAPRGSSWGPMLRELHADVFHVHGLDFPAQTQALARIAAGVPILLQDHASRPPRLWRRSLFKRSSALIDGVAFSAREQAEPFLACRLLQKVAIFEVPESTSRFEPGDRPQAREATGLDGEPSVLWVGHLNRNKDPLAVLEGVERAARTLGRLALYCCFGEGPLLGEVRRRIAARPLLRGRVHLLGRVPHRQVELLMRAADVFVLGSHRESCGNALLEALACGLPPVVTDIPSFRKLTAGAAVGALWPCGDAEALCNALVSVASHLGEQTRAAVRAHFDRELSFASVGAKLRTIYEELVS